MQQNTKYDFSFRCPRCEGFLFSAKKYDYPKNPEHAVNGKRPRRYFSEMYACINCGRLWRIEKDGIYLYPQGIPAKEIKNKT